MFVLIRGAGDLASGIALRLFRSGMKVVMTDLEKPTSIRRTVCFSEALKYGSASVEDVKAVRASSPEEAREIAEGGCIAVMADPEGKMIEALRPDALVDAILAKVNLGTRIDMAPVVIGVGPGFTAGKDCHAVVETMRGHTLGRVIREGSALPNTGVPGNIGGFTSERVLRAPADGVFGPLHRIGDYVTAGEPVGRVGDVYMNATIDGILRGILEEGTVVPKGMKAGDIDPRCRVEHCFTASDKAIAIGGGVLEAILGLSGVLRK